MIYCLEDDEDIRELVLYTLQTAGFEAQGFGESQSFWQAIHRQIPEVILLDILLPMEDGIQVLKKIRQTSQLDQTVVLMTTAKGTEFDKIKALDLGADDYLVKPFGMMEMVSRIKAILRRTKVVSEKEELCQGLLRIVPAERAVYCQGERLILTLKEYELLVLFAKHPRRIFTRQELLDRVWGESFFGETRTVDVHISSLRVKLQEAGGYIRTVRGVGYQLEVEND